MVRLLARLVVATVVLIISTGIGSAQVNGQMIGSQTPVATGEES